MVHPSQNPIDVTERLGVIFTLGWQGPDFACLALAIQRLAPSN